MNDSSTIARSFERQKRFVELLRRLTDQGKIAWVQSEQEPGLVYCLLGDEYLVFEVHGGASSALVPPTSSVTSIVSHCRNVTYQWLGSLHGGDTLLALLRQAPVDRVRFLQSRKAAADLPTRMLEKLAEE